MRFCVVMIEPPGYAYPHLFYDLCRMLAGGLRELGHECDIGCNDLPRGRIPILVGTHAVSDRSYPELVDLARRASPYILYQTEVVGPSALPSARGYCLNPTDRTTVRHVEGFARSQLPLMRHAAAVWTGVAGNLPVLATLGVRAQLLMGGYVEDLCAVRRRRRQDIDFLFFGSITDHRSRQLGALQRLGAQVVVVGLCASIYRDDLIARAAVHLAPNRTGTQEYHCWQRTCYLSNQACLVVCESAPGQDVYSGSFIVADTPDWPGRCLDVLHSPDREALRAACFERYRTIRFADHLRPLVESFSSELQSSIA